MNRQLEPIRTECSHRLSILPSERGDTHFFLDRTPDKPKLKVFVGEGFAEELRPLAWALCVSKPQAVIPLSLAWYELVLVQRAQRGKLKRGEWKAGKDACLALGYYHIDEPIVADFSIAWARNQLLVHERVAVALKEGNELRDWFFGQSPAAY